MTNALTLWIDCENEINRNALNGYQASDLGEMFDDVAHNIYAGPGLLDYTRL
jgi:hypothetical protein